jgi:hypothetical protein
MSRFKVRLKLQGFELEVEGSRDDIPLVTANVGQQMAALLAPSAQIVEGELAVPSSNGSQSSIPSNEVSKTKRRRRVPVQTNGQKPADVQAIDWKHDSARWGSPIQNWNTLKKSIWTLYVVSNAVQVKELTAAQIATTFNKHFRQSGAIRTGHVSRDLEPVIDLSSAVR